MIRYYFGLLMAITSLVSGEMPQTAIDPLIKPYMESNGIPGISVALYYEGKPYFISYGVEDRQTNRPVTEHTLFDLASITKVFSSTALAVEIQNGKMALSDPIIKYLPEIRRRNIPLAQVTLESLATHTSSLPRDPPQGNRERFMHFLENWRPSYPIGTKSVYSNLGFGLISYALAAVNGQGYEQEIREKVLRPLEMHSTGIEVSPKMRQDYAQGYLPSGKPAPYFHKSPWSAGGELRSTARDMMKFLEANMGIKGPPELMKAMQMAQQVQFKANEKMSMGLGWEKHHQGKSVIIEKNGGIDGYASYIGWIPENKIGIVLLSNKGKSHLTEMGRKILISLDNKGR